MIPLHPVLSNPPGPAGPRPSRPRPASRLARCWPALLAGALALSGCATTPPTRAPGAIPAPDLVFPLSDGTTLPARVWRPAGVPAAVLLALHGFGDSRDAWEEPAPGLAAAGLLVVAPDQRGFGATASRGRWPGADRLVSDAAEMVRALRRAHPGLPVVVMGESMGGAVAMLLAARGDGSAGSDAAPLLAGPPPALAASSDVPPLDAPALAPSLGAPSGTPSPGAASLGTPPPGTPFAAPPVAATTGILSPAAPPADPGVPDATVLVSPAVWTRAQLGPALSASLFVARTLLPDRRVTGGEVPLHLVACDDRAALLRLYYDPLTLRGTSFRALDGLVTLMDRAAAAAPRLHGRVLVMNGAHDQIVPPAAAAAVWARLPPTARRAFYTDGFHMLLRDRDRALPEADVLSWLRAPDRWLPSGADVAAAAWQADHAWEGEPSGLLPSTLDDLSPGTPLGF